MTTPAPIPDGPPYIPGIDVTLGERYDAADMYRDHPDLLNAEEPEP